MKKNTDWVKDQRIIAIIKPVSVPQVPGAGFNKPEPKPKAKNV